MLIIFVLIEMIEENEFQSLAENMNSYLRDVRMHEYKSNIFDLHVNVGVML
jgi:hypothetical protein